MKLGNYIIRCDLPRPAIVRINELMGYGLIGLEIGVFSGVNAESIVKTLVIEKLFLIDPYRAYMGKSQKVTVTDINTAYADMMKRLKKYKDKIKLFVDYSYNIVPQLPKLDFVYIDGCHDYDAVISDLKMCYEKVRYGGIISGHDVCLEEVARAVMDFTRDYNLNVEIIPPDFLIRKKNRGLPL